MKKRQRQLLQWFEQEQRDLPWRNTRDPWRILVSETMLQQTQVERVIPKYRAFLQQFPTATKCAQASLGDVIRLWDGLGYNRRAKHLHLAAQAITAKHGGVMPQTLPELLTLPGVGPYTARAVLAFAFEQDFGALDTNAARVMARAFAGKCLSPSEAQSLADEIVPSGSGWAWNQAIMDLGATICRKKTPLCSHCPLQKTCSWINEKNVFPDPAEGSAGVSMTQSRFTGSDRQGRGRIISSLRKGPQTVDELTQATGWGDNKARSLRIMHDLIDEGLVVQSGELMSLP